MRRRILYIAKRYSKVNTEYMKFYNGSKPSKYIMYLDVNNSYAWAMNQYLLYRKFKSLNKKEIDKVDTNLIG